MKEHYERKETRGTILNYKCDHPLYFYCTLFRYGDRGLSVIQQRYSEISKHTWWGPIDPWLVSDILENENLPAYLAEKARIPDSGMYPTVTVRQAMYALKMKPLRKHIWETRFF